MENGGSTGLCTTAVWLVSLPYGYTSHWTYVLQGRREDDLRHTFSSWKSTSAAWFVFFFLEAQGLLEIVMMKAGFLPWLPVSPWTIYLDVLKGLEAGKQELLCLCSESVDVSQLPSGTHMPKCPCAEEILCFRRLQILFYRSDSSSRSYCPSKKAHTCGQTHAGVSAMQLPFPYLSVCPPLVRVKLRCWTVKWSSWCTSTSAEPDVGAVISGRSVKQTAGGSKVWRGHN